MGCANAMRPRLSEREQAPALHSGANSQSPAHFGVRRLATALSPRELAATSKRGSLPDCAKCPPRRLKARSGRLFSSRSIEFWDLELTLGNPLQLPTHGHRRHGHGRPRHRGGDRLQHAIEVLDLFQEADAPSFSGVLSTQYTPSDLRRATAKARPHSTDGAPLNPTISSISLASPFI
jgi:hypothetical protein